MGDEALSHAKDVVDLPSSNSNFPWTVWHSFDTAMDKTYNQSRNERADLPLFEEKHVFVKLRPVNTACAGSFLQPESVYYWAQLQLRLYCSLVLEGSTTEFPELYKQAQAETDFWSKLGIQGVTTIGDLALLELCADCVMLQYLMPRIPKTRDWWALETSVKQCPMAQVFELIYFRLLRHLFPLIEAYLDFQGYFRVLMSLQTAKFLLTRSLNRQLTQNEGARVRSGPPRIESPVLRAACASPSKISNKVDTNAPILKQVLQPGDGTGPEASDLFAIKIIHCQHMKEWKINLMRFCQAGLDTGSGLASQMKMLEYLLAPASFPVEVVYKHVHKRAFFSITLVSEVVQKVCDQLYGTNDDARQTGEQVYNRWKDLVFNAPTEFKWFL